MHRVVFILLMSWLFSNVVAQDRTGHSYYDSLTYRQYNDARWKELTVDARKAIDHGYDYYYLRMRLGISLFERGNYLLAVNHFRRALEFNQGDPLATEYIYYCYLNAGKRLTANAVAADFSESLRKKTGVDKARVNRVSIDNLYSNALSQALVSNYTEVPGYGETGNLVIPTYYTNTGITFSKKINDKIYFSHAYTYLRRSSKLSYNDGTFLYNQYDQKLNQLQLYMSVAISNGRGLTVTPSMHYLFVSYPLLSISSSGMNPQAFSYNVTEHNFVSTLNINRTVSLFDLGIGGSYAYLNQSSNLQAKGSAYLSPAGNNKLYFGGSVAVRYNQFEGVWSMGTVYSGIFGFSMGDRVWLDLSVLYGEIRGYVDRSGFVIYNMLNEKDYSLKADISIPFGESGAIFYTGARYGSEYTFFIPENESVSSTLKENYKSISILGGISWEF